MEKKIQIEDICRILEIPVDSWKLRENMQPEEAQICIKEFKELAKKQKRVLSKKYHPDKPGGDIDKIKEINSTLDIIDKLKITVRPISKPIIHFHIRRGGYATEGFTGYYNTDTFTT